MTRIAITGGPRTGKTTLAGYIMHRSTCAEHPDARPVLPGTCVCPSPRTPTHHTDAVMGLGWSSASSFIAEEWLPLPGPWIIEGVAVSRALRKWRDQHPDLPPPVDRVIFLATPRAPLTKGQITMTKGVVTVHAEIAPWLEQHGVRTEIR